MIQLIISEFLLILPTPCLSVRSLHIPVFPVRSFLSGRKGKEKLQNHEDDKQLDQDEPPQCPSPCHLTETVPIKLKMVIICFFIETVFIIITKKAIYREKTTICPD